MKINVFTEKPGWITNRLAQELINDSEQLKLYFGLQTKLKIINYRFLRNLPSTLSINYFLPYYLMQSLKHRNLVTISCLTHYEPDNVFKRIGWEKALLYSDYFIAVSKFTYDQAISHGVDKAKIKIIKYGASDIYKPTYNVLIVGAPGVRKGQDFLNEVIDNCKVNTAIIWKSASESGWGLETICRSASDLRSAYGWADLLFVPSSLEGAHTGTIEALVAGLPVLSRKTGWARYELKNYVTTISTVDEAANFIINSAKNKNNTGDLNKIKILKSEFNYSSWRNEHYSLFNELLTLKSGIKY